MNGMLAVMTREMRMKALVPLAGLLSGVTVMLVGTAVQESGTASEIGQATLMLSLVFLLIVAGSLGVTMVGRDLAGSRSVFLLSRPISISAIYCGKVLAAVLLALFSAALFVLPAIVTGAQRVIDQEILYASAGLAIAMVTICAALEVLARARTLHLLLWAGLSIGLIWLAWRAGEPFRLGYINEVVYLFLALSVGVVSLGTLVAQAVAFATARYEVRSQARRFSFIYASAAAAVALVIAGTAWGLQHLPLSALHRFVVHDTSPDGSSAILAGILGNSDVRGAFAVDLESGRAMRMPDPGYRAALLSESHVLWADTSSQTGSLRMTTFPERSQIRREIIPGDGRLAAVSSDGRYIAWITSAATQIFTANGEMVMTIPVAGLGGQAAIRPIFESPTVLRLYEFDGAMWTVRGADLSRRSISAAGRFEGTLALLTTADGSTLVRVMRSGDPAEFHVIDKRSAAVALRIPSPSSVPTPLADGGWAFADANNALATIDRDGTIISRAIPAAGKLRTGGEIRPGLLMVHVSSGDTVLDRTTSAVHIVHLASGRIIKSWERTMPVARIFRSYPPIGSPAWRLVENDDGLQLIDAQTLELRPAVR